MLFLTVFSCYKENKRRCGLISKTPTRNRWLRQTLESTIVNLLNLSLRGQAKINQRRNLEETNYNTVFEDREKMRLQPWKQRFGQINYVIFQVISIVNILSLCMSHLLIKLPKQMLLQVVLERQEVRHLQFALVLQ